MSTINIHNILVYTHTTTICKEGYFAEILRENSWGFPITCYHQRIPFLHMGEDGQLLLAVENSTFGHQTFSMPTFLEKDINKFPGGGHLSCNFQSRKFGKVPSPTILPLQVEFETQGLPHDHILSPGA